VRARCGRSEYARHRSTHPARAHRGAPRAPRGRGRCNSSATARPMNFVPPRTMTRMKPPCLAGSTSRPWRSNCRFGAHPQSAGKWRPSRCPWPPRTLRSVGKWPSARSRRWPPPGRTSCPPTVATFLERQRAILIDVATGTAIQALNDEYTANRRNLAPALASARGSVPVPGPVSVVWLLPRGLSAGFTSMAVGALPWCKVQISASRPASQQRAAPPRLPLPERNRAVGRSGIRHMLGGHEVTASKRR
jgi:hypothetical protein